MKKKVDRNGMILRRVLRFGFILCFACSFYVTYYKLIIEDDWAGLFYDLCLGLSTGLIAGIAVYYLTSVTMEKNDKPEDPDECGD